MNDPLEASANKFYKARGGIRRVFGGNGFGVRRPPFLIKDPQDGLNILFKNLDHLWAKGVVTWGAVVQANHLLFKKSEKSCPAVMVYSLEDPSKVDRTYLMDLSYRLYDLKGTEPEDPRETLIAAQITDERASYYGLEVATTLSAQLACKMSVTFFERKLIPGQIILKKLLPVVASPCEPFIVLPLPERFWDPEYKKWWLANE